MYLSLEVSVAMKILHLDSAGLRIQNVPLQAMLRQPRGLFS